MPQLYKAVIIGTSLSGKTTVIRYLRENTQLFIKEIDEELTTLNGGSYPNDDVYKHTVLAPKIIAKVLESEKILFFTNVDYFTPENLFAARQKGFKIIQLYVDKEELNKRNKYRIENDGYEDHSQWFDAMLQYQTNIKDKGLVDTVINTQKPVETIAQELIAFIQQKQ